MNESTAHMEELQVHIDLCSRNDGKRAANVRSIHAHRNYQYQHFICKILIIFRSGVDVKQFESDKQPQPVGLD